MMTSITYDATTMTISEEGDSRDKRWMIYVFGEEGQGFLTRARFGGRYRASVSDIDDPEKARRMSLKQALGLLGKLDECGLRANLVCFPSVIMYH